jgi:RNase P/RNase MRP subunit p29
LQESLLLAKKKVFQFNNQTSIASKNITKIQLIGKEIQVKCYGKTFSGYVNNETKNTLQIITKSGLKILPKDQANVQIKINNQLITIKGTQLKGRHEDRIKHRMKRKW